MHPSDIRIGQTELSIIELNEMMQSGQLTVTLDTSKWDTKLKSMSIESVLLGLTMTPIYVDASIPDEWLILDGGKRLNALKEFISNKFELNHLEFLVELDTFYYSSLPKNIQRRLLQSKFTVYSINQGVSPEVRLSLIRRIVPDIKSGLSLKMLERLLTPEALEMVEMMETERVDFISKLLHKKNEMLRFKIEYLNILYSIFKKERFENYDIHSKPEDVVIFTNQYANRDNHFIIEIWDVGLYRLDKLLVACEIPAEVSQFLNRYFEYFIISLGQIISNQEFEILTIRSQKFIWEIAGYLHDEDGRMRFLKYAKQQRINQIYKLAKETIK